MTVPHHSEPAREAVKVPDLSIESAAAFLIVCAEYFERRPTHGEDAAHWANVSNGAMCRKIATMLSASPAPAAGGLEAVRVTRKLLLEWSEDFDEASKKFERLEKCVLRTRAQECRDLAALASPAATPVQRECEECSGTGHTGIEGDEVYDCPVCLGEGTAPAPAATSAETQGGDGVREVENRAVAAIEAQYAPEIATYARGLAKCVIAALAPSTSAATRGEAVGWLPMNTAPKGYPTEDAGCRGTSEWFFGRVAKEFRKHGAAPFVVIRRKAWPHEDDWECNGEAHYVPRYFDGWRPLNDAPAPAVESAQVKVKPLVWRVEHGYTARADSPVEIYAISEYDGLPEPFKLMGVGHRSIYFMSIDEAKAAAQADYESRIRASLDLATDAEG